MFPHETIFIIKGSLSVFAPLLTVLHSFHLFICSLSAIINCEDVSAFYCKLFPKCHLESIANFGKERDVTIFVIKFGRPPQWVRRGRFDLG